MKIKVNVQKIFQRNIIRKQFFLTLEVFQYTKEGMIVKKIIFSSHKIVGNRFVVPYNLYLLLKLRCHINIEVFNTIKSIKYLLKYFYEGPNTAIICLSNSENTIEDHLQIFL